MGWLRNRRRNRLMSQLLEEGKLAHYKNRIHQFLEDLNQKENKLVKQVKEVHAKDETLAKISIEQVREIVALKEKVQQLNAYLENLSNKAEAASVYDDFLSYLKNMNRQDLKKVNNRRTKKTIKSSNGSIKEINQWIELIEKRVSKVDRSALDDDNQKRNSKDKIDIKAFLEAYE